MDWLEHYIDQYGVINVKSPDIWGEARLTKHRQEFERQMEAQIGTFSIKLNAAISRSDQAFLSSATALSAAISSGRAVRRRATEPGDDITVPNVNIATANIPAATWVYNETSKTWEMKVDTAAPPVIFRSDVGHDKFAGLRPDSGEISLEPTIVLDQHKRFLDHLNEIRRVNEGDDTADTPGYSLNLVRIPISVLPGGKTRKGYGAEVTITAEPYLSETLLQTTMRRLIINEAVEMLGVAVLEKISKTKCAPIVQVSAQAPVDLDRQQITDSGTPTLDSALPFSFFEQVFPEEILAALAEGAGNTLFHIEGDHHLLDVRTALQSEAEHAYDMMMDPDLGLWNPDELFELAKAFRIADANAIQIARATFLAKLKASRKDGQATASQDAMAWATYACALLINERLIRDMKEMGPALKCHTGCVLDGAIFVGPMIAEDAVMTFNAYVNCRWPIHVFALDPVIEEQNVADSFARRRELQLALSMAFASGRMNASNLTKFVRRLEWDIDTIALNRTVVGFSSGNDTFGWRFYPRVQTPPIKGNISTFMETWLGGPTTDQDLRQRQIEPGMRECIAIVLMPSFVPYARFDTRCNWFKITCPKHTEVTIHDAMKMSESIRSMQDPSTCLIDADRYREGELERLQRRVHQLSGDLPLQTMHCQVPVDMMLTGFEVFATGTSELAPDLYGYYGEPGVVLGQPTTIYVLGRNFSVHDTSVIAGNRECAFELLSRRIMKVVIPPDARPLVAEGVADHACGPKCATCGGKQFVDLHVATPYGVTRHLKIPVVPPTGGMAINPFRWDPAEYIVEVPWKTTATVPPTVQLEDVGIRYFKPTALSIPWPSQYPVSGAWTADLEITTPTGEVIIALPAKSLTIDTVNQRFSLDLNNIVAGATGSIRANLQSYIVSRKKLQATEFPNDLRITGVLKGNSQVLPIDGEAHLKVRYNSIP